VRRLTGFQQALFLDMERTLNTLKNQDTRQRLLLEDLPPAVRNRFIGRSGKYLLQVFPKEDVWERKNQEQFVTEIRSIVPEVTGSPVRFFEYTDRLKKSFERSSLYALGAIILLVFIHFRKWNYVFLALLPIGAGFLWMLGIIGFFRIPLNPVNLMSFPLILGIGVASGIHILNRFAEEKNPSILAKSTGKAVLVSALTTIVGFGTLMLGQHPGIASLGLLMSLGTAMCLVAALAFLPALLNFLERRGVRLIAHSHSSSEKPLQVKKREEPGLAKRSSSGHLEPGNSDQ
jgi:uncharacterized protein